MEEAQWTEVVKASRPGGRPAAWSAACGLDRSIERDYLSLFALGALPGGRPAPVRSRSPQSSLSGYHVRAQPTHTTLPLFPFFTAAPIGLLAFSSSLSTAVFGIHLGLFRENSDHP